MAWQTEKRSQVRNENFKIKVSNKSFATREGPYFMISTILISLIRSERDFKRGIEAGVISSTSKRGSRGPSFDRDTKSFERPRLNNASIKFQYL